MANLTRIKILTTGATTTAPSNIKTGELAYSYVSGTQANNGDRLYIGTGTESGGVASSVDLIGGKYFTGLLDHVHGTLTASSAIITDSAGKISALNVDNLNLDANTLSSTDTNGNIVLDPNGTGKTVLNNPYINGTTDTLQEFIYDTVGGAITASTGITVANDDAANTSTISITNTAVTAGSYGGTGKTVSFTVNAQGQLTAAAEANLPDLAIAGDSGTGAIDLNTETITFAGDTGITTAVSGNSVSIDLDNTAVTAASYGSATAIPTFTVDQQGRLTAAADVAISSSFTLAADSGSNDVFNNGETLTFAGLTGITTTVSAGPNNTISIDLDDTASDMTATNSGVYGSATAIPVITVDRQGRLTAATTATIATTLNLAADSGTDDGVQLLTDTLTVSGTANEIETSVSGDTITVGIVSNPTLTGNVIVSGNLTVQGTQTSVESTVVAIDDAVMMLADNSSTTADALDRGIGFKWGDGSAVKDGFFGLDRTSLRFVFKPDDSAEGNSSDEDYTSPWGDAEFGNIYGTGADLGNITVGIADDNTITTVSGKLVLDSNTNEVEVNADLDVNGDADVSGTLSAGTLTLTNDLAVAHGGTGVSSFTGNSILIANAGGTALSSLTSSLGTAGDIVQFNASGVPVVSNIIDGGTY